MMKWKPPSTFLFGLIIGFASFVGLVQANCWEDANLNAQAARVVRQHFPRIAHLPELVVCAASDFPPSVGGNFTGGSSPLIRVPVWQLGSSELSTVLAHELAHYQSYLDGTDDGTAGGHGTGWMAVMLAAGLDDEAQRVAASVPGAGLALAQVQGGQQSPRIQSQPEVEYLPPQHIPPQVVTCFLQPQQTIVHDRRGRHYFSTFFVQICSTG